MYPVWVACIGGGHPHGVKEIMRMCLVDALARISIISLIQGEIKKMLVPRFDFKFIHIEESSMSYIRLDSVD